MVLANRHGCFLDVSELSCVLVISACSEQLPNTCRMMLRFLAVDFNQHKLPRGPDGGPTILQAVDIQPSASLRHLVIGRGDVNQVALAARFDGLPPEQWVSSSNSQEVQQMRAAAASVVTAEGDGTSQGANAEHMAAAKVDGTLQGANADHLAGYKQDMGVLLQTNAAALEQAVLLFADAPDAVTGQAFGPHLVDSYASILMGLNDAAARTDKRKQLWFIAGIAQQYISGLASAKMRKLLSGAVAVDEAFVRWGTKSPLLIRAWKGLKLSSK